MESEQFEKLIDDLKNDFDSVDLTKLSNEDLSKLQARIDPMAGVRDEGPIRAAAFNTFNFRESYYQRLAMTSLIGFIHQCVHEWDVPSSTCQYTPKEVVAEDPMNIDDLIKSLESALDVAKKSKQANLDAAKYREADLIDDFKNKGLKNENTLLLKESEARYLALLYTSTAMVSSIGENAKKRLHATYVKCSKNKDVSDELLNFKAPLAPGIIEIPKTMAKKFIEDFISFWFGYDYTKNVRMASSKQSGKEVRAAIDAQVSKVKSTCTSNDEHVRLVLEDRRIANIVNAISTDEQIRDVARAAIDTPEKFVPFLDQGMIYGRGVSKTGLKDDSVSAIEQVIPPQDTFQRGQNYQDVNYDYLRKITEIIYDERSDIDQSIVIWEIFEGETQEDVNKQFDDYCKEREGEVFNEYKSANLGKFVITASTKANRNVINFLNSKTEILEKIITKNVEDRKIGADLMKNRVRNEKAKNIAEAGPDHPNLAAYRQNQGRADLSASGGEKVLGRAETLRLEKTKGNRKAAQELEVIEQYEATIKRLESLESLNAEERRELSDTKELHIKAYDMLNVPDNAVRVDYFETDHVNDTFEHKSFHTKADDIVETDKKTIGVSELNNSGGASSAYN